MVVFLCFRCKMKRKMERKASRCKKDRNEV